MKSLNSAEIEALSAAAGEAFGREPERPPGACLQLNPGGVEEAAAVVGLARREGRRLAPVGADLLQNWPAAGVDLLLGSSRMNRLVDYQPDDMTVTAGPGMSLAQLDLLLRDRDQFLPLNPPLPEQATLGGMVAAAASGPWRAGYGTPRDWLIGCRVLDSDGQEVRGGGQVVKNVAGYDLPRLYTNSFGTLGMLTELTFKVTPRPAARAFVQVSGEDLKTLEPVLAAISASDLAPASCEMFLESPRPDWNLLLEFHHVPEALRWQVQELLRLAAPHAARTRELEEMEGAKLLDDLRDAPAAPVCARFDLLSSRVAELAGRLRACLNEAGLEGRLTAGALTGQVRLMLPSGAAPALPVERLDAIAQEAGALFRMTGEAAPPATAAPLPNAALQRAVKQAMDPAGLFHSFN